MEIEFQRKLIELEGSVKDIDERLAELYRETAGLSLQKSTVVQKVRRDVAASKRCADEVKRIHLELKTGLDDVSRKLARMDAVIMKLNSMRRAARKEKSKEFAELASSILRLNKRVSKINKLVEKVRVSDSRIDALQKEVSELKKITSKKPSKATINMEGALARLESIIDQKIDSGQLQDALGDVSGALSAEIESLHKKLSKSISELENQLKDVESSISKVSKGAKAGVASPLDLVKLERVDKKIETIRKRANSILKEIYDTVDELRVAHADFQDQAARNAAELQGIRQKIMGVENKLESLPRGSDEELDVTGLIAEVEELRNYINTLAKGLDISKAIAEELKTIQAKVSAVEAWKARAEDVPRELEKLAERLAEIEKVKGLEGEFARKEDVERLAAQLNNELGALRAKAQGDLKSLKSTVAEFSNKLRLINALALENQKMQHRLFVLEDLIGTDQLKEKISELEGKVKEIQPPEDGLHARVSDLQAELEHIRPLMLGIDDIKKRVELLETTFHPRPLQQRMENLESEIKKLSEKVKKGPAVEQGN